MEGRRQLAGDSRQQDDAGKRRNGDTVTEDRRLRTDDSNAVCLARCSLPLLDSSMRCVYDLVYKEV